MNDVECRQLTGRKLLRVPCSPTSNVRCFWEYVNMMFNKPDPERIKLVGPDRACAEWVLRNGGAVKWSNGETLKDYNLLPSPEQGTKRLLEIDGTNSAISHYGFAHLAGCQLLESIILHNDKYIEDRAMTELAHGKDTLLHLQVSQCAGVSDSGLKELQELKKLKTLVLFSLENVSDLNDCGEFLKSKLPSCNVQTTKYKMANS